MSAGSTLVVRFTNYCVLWGMRTGAFNVKQKRTQGGGLLPPLWEPYIRCSKSEPCPLNKRAGFYILFFWNGFEKVYLSSVVQVL